MLRGSGVQVPIFTKILNVLLCFYKHSILMIFFQRIIIRIFSIKNLLVKDKVTTVYFISFDSLLGKCISLHAPLNQFAYSSCHWYL